jgi:HK97 family phage prohead protease
MKTVKLPKHNIRADIKPETYNEKENTIDVVFTTDTPVRRFDFFEGPYDEVLGMNPEEVRLERLNAGAPVLNNHNRFELEDQIGVVMNASVDGKKGEATLKLSKRESIREIIEDIKDGIIRNISVGYRIHAMEKTGENEEIPTFRAIDWTPLEISFVTVPADANAQVKNLRNEKQEELYDCEIRGINMDENTKETITEEVKTEAEEVAVETEAEKEEARSETEIEVEAKKEETKTEVSEEETVRTDEEVVETKSEDMSKAERSRILEIQDFGKRFDIEQKEVNNFIENEKSVQEFKDFVMEKLAERDNKKGTRTMNENKIEVGKTDLDKRKEGIENAMLAKSNIINNEGRKAFELNDNGKRFNNMSLIEMAREVLEARGVETRNMPKHQVAERAFHATGDFKEILANVLNKSLRQGYEASPQTFSPFTRMIEVDDLKEISRTQFGEGGLLKKVKEGEEYKHDTVSENAEKYKVEKYGKIVNVTEETLINDDLGAFTRIPAIFGQRARDLESDLAWGIVKDNANMSDGNALFSSQHGNLLTGAGSSLQESSLADARKSFRKQLGLDGMKLNLSPVYLAVPEDLETTAEKLLSSIQPDATSNFNPFGPTGRTPLSLIVEPRLADQSALEWYMFGSLGQIDMIEMAMLRGMNGPMITQKEGFDVDGLRVKIKHWVGVKAIDWRGMLKSNGQ